jgi:hypothetical protein
MKCTDCLYLWKEDAEKYPRCHWESRAPGDEPPCEDDGYWEDNDAPLDSDYF